MADGAVSSRTRSSVSEPMARKNDDHSCIVWSTVFRSSAHYQDASGTGNPTSRLGRGAEDGFPQSKTHRIAL